MRIITTIFVFLLVGCTGNKSKLDKRLLDFGSFTIETPKGWKKIKRNGIDSYVGQIAIDATDMLYFDLGWYSNTLTEDESQKINTISWEMIDNRKAKIVFPIKSGNGTTGVYIDSLWEAGSDVDRFNLYGSNLKPENEKLVLQAIKTLKFYKKK